MTTTDNTIDGEVEHLINKYELVENGLPAMGDLRTTKGRFRDALQHKIAQEANKAELKGMEAVNNCHGCVDNNEYLDERRAELVKLTADKEQA